MKRSLFVLLTVLSAAHGFAQNDFSKQKFYSLFRQLDADAQNHFVKAKGEKLRSISYFSNVHRSKIMLPGADSGTISVPLQSGRYSATFYMKPGKTFEEAKQREALLLKAIRKAYKYPLREQQENDTIKRFIYYSTLLFKDARSDLFDKDFETYIVFDKELYYLMLVMYERVPIKQN